MRTPTDIISDELRRPVLDLTRSKIDIPTRFQSVLYNGDLFPGAAAAADLQGGANCQQYAFTLLRDFGFRIPDVRSSELWVDTDFSFVVSVPAPLDLVLLNRSDESWGAHVGVIVADGMVLHLSRQLVTPAIEALEAMQQRDEYRCLIGFKRLKHRTAL